MNEIKMVVTDLDGTYLKNDKTVSEYTKRVTETLRKRGIPFVIATARPIRAVAVDYDAGIFHNGAVLLNASGKVLSIGVERPGAVISRILRENPDCHIAAEAGDRLYANFDAERIWRGADYLYTSDFIEIGCAEADKIIIETDGLEGMSRFQKYLSEDLYLQLSENTVAMIMNRRATKMNGIRRLAREYGIETSEVAAFGDDYNDMEMLEGCGMGVAVDNALKAVKAVADERCESNENDGVARWLAANIGLLK